MITHERKTPKGFTLVEIVAVLTVIMILTASLAPLWRKSILSGRLHEADAFLQQLASLERRYYQRYGKYFVSSNGDEQELEDALGVSLRQAGSFCFLVRTSGFVSDSATPEFEVWAVLRDRAYSSGSSGNDIVAKVEGFPELGCTTADDKDNAGGWVAPNSSGVGGEGRLVVLRYPPPATEMDTARRNGRSGITLRWDDGISYTDALL